MKKFEYIAVSETQLQNNQKYRSSYYSKPESIYDYYELNHFGDDGWELVSVTTTFETGTIYYFKREISNGSN